MHRHTPIEFCSDAFEKPILVKCADCGEVLDVSSEALDSLYADRTHNGGLCLKNGVCPKKQIDRW